MTKEIWVTVIVAIAQIIVSVLVAWKQISVAKSLANPEQKQEIQSTSLLDKTLKYFSNIPLHIIIPLIVCIVSTARLVDKVGLNVFVLFYVVCWVFLLIIQSVLWWIMKSISFFSGLLLKHEKRLKCHESILFDLTDKPCKDEGKCKFDV